MKHLLAVVAFVLGTALPAGAANYPTPPPENLGTPFTGAPVTPSWFGRWRETGDSNTGVVWQMFSKRAAACRTLVAGRTTCFVIRVPGQSGIWAGAITLSRGKVVFRMTYRPRPNTIGCFADDEYTYRLSKKQILILHGASSSCMWEPTEHFPIHLERMATR
jgi:hypothetical protein